MFQPEVKYEFVKRYCSPRSGWTVFTDIDASEVGRTGGERKSDAARMVQARMQEEGRLTRQNLNNLGVTVGGSRAEWFNRNELPIIQGDRDIVAFHREKRICVIAEVEGTSTGQAEQKLYKAIGQIVLASGFRSPDGWACEFVLVVHGDKIKRHLRSAHALTKLGITGISIEQIEERDEFLFVADNATLPKLISGELQVPDAARIVRRAM